MCFSILVNTSKYVLLLSKTKDYIYKKRFKWYFKVKLLIWHYYNVHLLKAYLSVLKQHS